MARTRNEVTVGAGTMWTAPVGEAFPDVDEAPVGNWVDIGYSDAGWAFGGDFTFEDLEVEEEVDALDTFKTAQTLRVAGAIAQPSLENFILVFNGGTVANDAGPPDKDTYTPPATDSFTATAGLLVVDGTSGFVRQYRFQKMINVAAFEVPYRSAPDKAIIAVEFRLLLPTAGNIFEIHEANS